MARSLLKLLVIPADVVNHTHAAYETHPEFPPTRTTMPLPWSSAKLCIRLWEKALGWCFVPKDEVSWLEPRLYNIETLAAELTSESRKANKLKRQAHIRVEQTRGRNRLRQQHRCRNQVLDHCSLPFCLTRIYKE